MTFIWTQVLSTHHLLSCTTSSLYNFSHSLNTSPRSHRASFTHSFAIKRSYISRRSFNSCFISSGISSTLRPSLVCRPGNGTLDQAESLEQSLVLSVKQGLSPLGLYQYVTSHLLPCWEAQADYSQHTHLAQHRQPRWTNHPQIPYDWLPLYCPLLLPCYSGTGKLPDLVYELVSSPALLYHLPLLRSCAIQHRNFQEQSKSADPTSFGSIQNS
jgi:hypothetical protein